MINLTFNINPVPASRPKVTRYSVYYGKKYTQFKKDMSILLRKYGGQKYTGIVRCDIEFHIQIAKSTSKKKKNLLDGQYCDNNADLDNYEKAVLDSLTGVTFGDDSSIVELSSSKRWAIDGKINVKIYDLAIDI